MKRITKAGYIIPFNFDNPSTTFDKLRVTSLVTHNS